MQDGLRKNGDFMKTNSLTKPEKSEQGIIAKSNFQISFDLINLQIVQHLLENPLIKASEIAGKLDVPLSTVQRRKRNIEHSSLFTKKYEIDPKQFGFRKADITISIKAGGQSKQIADEIAEKYPKNILEISSRMGDSEADLVVSVTYQDSVEIYNILEDIKNMEYSENVKWSELIQVILKKDSELI
jgi:DNA-binding Lrp family transcriptional regulator